MTDSDQFKLSIELGNDAMQRPVELAAALKQVADKVVGGETDGKVYDLNGNYVGDWSVAWPEPENECEGHPAGPFDPMGVTTYCDGSCRTDR